MCLTFVKERECLLELCNISFLYRRRLPRLGVVDPRSILQSSDYSELGQANSIDRPDITPFLH